MDLSFANPAGFWALLGLPAIIAIHFLQRQSRVVTISTLFLLEQLNRQSIRGRKIERIRNSVPLWLQLLMVLLITWILIQPRWMRTESVQRIAVVLDSSASMSVYKNNLKSALRDQLSALAGNVSRTEYIVTESAIGDLTLYNGASLEEMLTSVEDWRPRTGAHDFGESLRIARSLVGGDGLVVLCSDHLHPILPFNARLLAVGAPKANVGFAGLSIFRDDEGRPGWRTIVRNYSDVPQTRIWHFFAGNQRSPDTEINFDPDQSRTLEALFPEDTTDITVRLSTDDFPLDDQLPVIVPQPKRLTLARVTPPELKETIDQVVASLGDITPFTPNEEEAVDEPSLPDLSLYTYDPLSPSMIDGDALVLVEQISLSRQYFSGRMTSENHPLMEGLNWQGLIASRSPGVPLGENDTALLWQDDRALIFLRTEGGNRQLFLNFRLSTSNAPRLPAFVVLMHRFVEMLRKDKVAAESKNFETGQTLDLAFERSFEADANAETNDETAPAAAAAEEDRREPPPLRYRYYPLPGSPAEAIDEIVPLAQASLLRAPREPGRFSVDQGDERLLTAAAIFADTREADLRNADDYENLSDATSDLIDLHSETDNFWQLWLILLLTTLLICWYFVEKKKTTPVDEQPVDKLLTPNS